MQKPKEPVFRFKRSPGGFGPTLKENVCHPWWKNLLNKSASAFSPAEKWKQISCWFCPFFDKKIDNRKRQTVYNTEMKDRGKNKLFDLRMDIGGILAY